MLEVGVREVKEVAVYPLSLAHQLQLSDMIFDVAQAFMAIDFDAEDIEGKDNSVKAVESAIDILKDNITKLFPLIADEGDITAENITNVQLFELAKIVYEVNYADLAKNLKSLPQKMKTLVKEAKKAN